MRFAPAALGLAATALALACLPWSHAERAAPAPPVIPATLAVRGNVVHPDGSFLEDAVVLVEGDRIVRVGPARDIAIPSGARVVGGRGRWVIPGLVDAHVHFFQSGGLYTRPDIVDLTARVPYAKERAAVWAQLDDTFRRYLRSGVTSVVDMGGPMRNFEVRDRAARTVLAPRVAVAGPLLSSVSRAQLALDDPPIVQVNDPAAARAMVREQAKHHPDLVKLWYVVPQGGTAAAWLPVARAAIEEAHGLGLRVAAHATELETARAAVQAGADVLVHSVEDADVDDAFVQLLRDRGTLYVTTLVVFEGYWEVFHHHVRLSPMEVLVANPGVVATLLEPFPERAARGERPPVPPAALRNARRLWEAGVTVAAGTDAGNIGTFHGPALHRELELLAQAGLAPWQALAAATQNAARVMGRANDLGTVEERKLADLVVLDESPLADVRNCARIAAVVKGGRAWLPDEILPRTAADVVQAQVNAYDAQDLDAFVSTYAPDAVVTSAKTGELARGREALRKRYGDLFAKYPQNRARIAERKTEGDAVVVDHEIVTGRAPDKPDPWDVGWVRYVVEGGLIRRVELP